MPAKIAITRPMARTRIPIAMPGDRSHAVWGGARTAIVKLRSDTCYSELVAELVRIPCATWDWLNSHEMGYERSRVGRVFYEAHRGRHCGGPRKRLDQPYTT